MRQRTANGTVADEWRVRRMDGIHARTGRRTDEHLFDMLFLIGYN